MSYGLHFTDTYAGRVFVQSATPLGLAIPIYTATAIAGGMPIWNQSSLYTAELISVDIDYGSGTADFGTIGIMALYAGQGLGNGCSAFAATTPMNGKLFGGNATQMVSSNAGTVTVTAGVATPPTKGSGVPGWYQSIASINLEAATGTAHGTGIATYNFNGTVEIPPGVMIYLACTKASVALYASSIKWKEIAITR